MRCSISTAITKTFNILTQPIQKKYIDSLQNNYKWATINQCMHTCSINDGGGRLGHGRQTICWLALLFTLHCCRIHSWWLTAGAWETGEQHSSNAFANAGSTWTQQSAEVCTQATHISTTHIQSSSTKVKYNTKTYLCSHISVLPLPSAVYTRSTLVNLVTLFYQVIMGIERNIRRGQG